MRLHSFLSAPVPAGSGGATSDITASDILPLTPDGLRDIGEHMLDLKALVDEAKTTAEVFHDSLMKIMAISGKTQLSNTPLPQDLDQVTEWSATMEQLYQNLLAGADFASTALGEAAAGTRRISWPASEPSFSLEKLLSDPFSVALTKDGIPLLITPTGQQFNAPMTSTLGEPITIGTVIIIVAAVAGAAAITYFGVQGLMAGLRVVREIALRLTEVYLHHQMFACAESKSVEDCKRLSDTTAANHAAVMDAETRKLAKENEGLRAMNEGLWAFATIGVVMVGGFAAYKWYKSGALK